MNSNTEESIQTIMETNKLQDFKALIQKRKCLNTFNETLIYLFHTVQTIGILTTTIATSYENQEIAYVGIGLNFVASLLSIYEKINASLSSQWEKDIEAIQSGAYVDGSFLEDKPEV
jgi:hypothetical protein